MKLQQKMHRAIVRVNDKKLVCKYVKTPDVEENSVMVKMDKVGVCGTDLQMLSGLRPDPAKILGHEGIGEVICVGKDIKKYQVGDKVTFMPLSSTNLDSVLGHTYDGLLQEKFLVSSSDIKREMLVKLPNSFPNLLGPLIEPLASVVYAHELVLQKIGSPETIAVFGGGQTGLLHALYIKCCLNNIRVFLVHHSQDRLNWAIQKKIISKSEGVLSNNKAMKNFLTATKNTVGVDVSVLCTPRNVFRQVMTDALEVTKNRGCIDLFGGFDLKDALSVLPNTDLNQVRRENCCGEPDPGYIELLSVTSDKSIWFTGHRGVALRHMHKAIELLMQYPEYFSRIISHVVSFDAADELLNNFSRNKERKINGSEWLKVVIDWKSDDGLIKTA